jgi:hypothetical protein
VPILVDLREMREKLQEKIKAIDVLLEGNGLVDFDSPNISSRIPKGKGKPKRVMSAAARAKIGKAAKARWAKVRAEAKEKEKEKAK